MKLVYRDFVKEDLPIWDKLARSEFKGSDFCSSRFLLNHWNDLKGFILLNQDGEWIGCCFNDWEKQGSMLLYNPDGVQFLESCIFPKFRGKGFGKYLVKLHFEYSIGYKKSACIRPDNFTSKALYTKYGLKEAGIYKSWTVFVCDDIYPSELKKLELLYVRG